jgi:hypothetical protein
MGRRAAHTRIASRGELSSMKCPRWCQHQRKTPYKYLTYRTFICKLAVWMEPKRTPK